MQITLDLEEALLSGLCIEELLFSPGDIVIKKNSSFELGSGKVVSVAGSRNDKIEATNDLTHLTVGEIGIYSSGTTRGSTTLVWRSKKSVLQEVLELERSLSFLKNKKVAILATPNHSFGLIPGILTAQRLTSQLSIILCSSPIDMLKHLFELKPQAIYAVPAHLRLISEWVQKRELDLSFPKEIIFEGSFLQPNIIHFFTSRGAQFTSIYGTTQTGAIAVKHNIDTDNLRNSGKILSHLSISFENAS